MEEIMSQKKQVVLIVLEAAEVSLIEQWSREGRLPAIQRLMEQGVWCKMTSPGYISSGCVWPSLSVGINPGKHGFGFFHRQLKSGTYRIVKKYADELSYDCFWIPLSRAGKRVAIMDVPLTRPHPDINGVFFCRWGDEHPSWKPASMPVGLLDELTRKFGSHPLNDWYQDRLNTPEEWSEWVEQIRLGSQRRTEITKYVLRQEQWDLVVANYAEPHWAGHMGWHIHDKEHPEHDPELAARCGDVLLTVYEALDTAIAEIQAEAPDAVLMVISPIGMGAHTGMELMSPIILDRLGMGGELATKSIIGTLKRRLLPGGNGISNSVQRTEQIISPKLMTVVKKIVPERLWDDLTRRFLSLGTNWKDSKAFIVPGDNATLIRINLKGREPNGKVEPAAGYDELCEELATAFLELKETATGQPAVEKVVRLHEVLRGDCLQEMPDLAVIWRRGPPLRAVESERIGHIELEEFHKRPGGHLEPCFMLVAGPGIKKRAELQSGDLLDIVPTIFAILQTPAPDYLDGKSLLKDMTSEQEMAQTRSDSAG